jgi:DeoR/GlpR family transcriptional regulator of sugar metabolism
MKRTLIQTAGSVAVAVLNEKLDSVAAHKVSEIDSIADVVVEADAPASAVMALSEKGLQFHKAASVPDRGICPAQPARRLS